MQIFDIKDPAESVVLTFDFSDELATGETLTGAPTVSIVAQRGEASSMLNGAAAVDAAGKKVLQAVQGGTDGGMYVLKAICQTTNAKKILARKGQLPVEG